MKWLVCYDVADDDRRAHLVKVLLDYGQRVQESVFWIDAEEELIVRMRGRAAMAVNAEEDSLWLVPVCDACARKVEATGLSRVPQLPEYYVV
jgi:CRISPR-associated protein Cas2